MKQVLVFANLQNTKIASSVENSSYLFIKIQSCTLNLHDLFHGLTPLSGTNGIIHVYQTKPPRTTDCDRSELQIFLLFFQSLSSWTTATCRGADEDLCEELQSSGPGKIKRKMHLQ